MFIYREIGFTELWQIVVNSVYLIAQILIIVTGAGIYSRLMTTSGIPQHLIGTVTALKLPHWETLLFVNGGKHS
jgi:TRAP-type C4-dicarboxylate transport system permease large subunit